MNKPITVLTKDGVAKLEAELENLKTVKRREVAEKIKVALSFGDLSENSEYDEAKNEQGIVESRIAEIEATLAHAQVIDSDDITTEKVGIGTVVKILDMDMDEEMEFQIVGTSEANIDKGQMSDESPIGAALIGRKIGEVVDVETPSGMIQFEILNISKKEEE
ncbi:MAG: transcription elongation factor GreA [Oscillospiraceae bacterium]|nr:transcription elongation factor GreA [Oscillospiraceae bacterium]MBQ4165193.1 transcription elongation factor GreA [Oscillospiraceae bacterium]